MDTDRAVEVLRARQLDISESRLALWVRVAVLRKASRAEFSWSPNALTIRFDGSPLSAAEIMSPLAGLLDEQASSAAARWLALAVLHSVGPDAALTLESGPARARRAVRIDAEGYGPARPGLRLRPDTVARISWPLPVFHEHPATHPSHWSPCELNASIRGCPIRLKLSRGEERAEHAPVAIGKRELLRAEVRRDPARFLLSISGEEPSISVRFALHGVAAGSSVSFPSALPVSVWAEDPRLSLNASLSEVVQDAAREAALAAAREEALRWAFAVLERQKRVLSVTGQLLVSNPLMRTRWVRALGLPRVRGAKIPTSWHEYQLEAGPAGRSPDAHRVDECAQSTLRLRDAARRALTDKRKDGADALKTALWKTPLFLDDRGGTLSLDDLSADPTQLTFWSGFEPAPEHVPGRVWALSPRDSLFLRVRFPQRMTPPGEQKPL
ncbi:MAG: hypothetical protein NTX64_08145 [Elusimicrobia bacterium]|nr:hypothetical protein [Elusimicrobiota bacterium]